MYQNKKDHIIYIKSITILKAPYNNLDANISGILTIESNLYLQPVMVMSIGLVISFVMI